MLIKFGFCAYICVFVCIAVNNDKKFFRHNEFPVILIVKWQLDHDDNVENRVLGFRLCHFNFKYQYIWHVFIKAT